MDARSTAKAPSRYPDPMSTMIRKALREDAPRIWEVRRAAIASQCRGYYSAETLELWIGDHMPESFPEKVHDIYYVAVLSTKIIGAGAIELDSGRIEAMCVDPEHIGTGSGKRLIQHLEAVARQAHIRRLHLESSLNAVPFYQACGFARLEKSQYHSPRGFSLECILMAKNL